VYAIFTTDKVNVVFNDEGNVDVQQTDFGTALKTNQIPTPVGKVGHTFKEWNTQANGLGSKFVGTEIINEDISVYAIYTVNQVTVTFINGTQIDTATVDYNNAIKEADIPTATKVGHTFKEWNTQEDGLGTKF